MATRTRTIAFAACSAATLILATHAISQEPQGAANPPRQRDAAAEAQAVRPPQSERPELKLNAHDQSPVFDRSKPAPISEAIKTQPKEGRLAGFDFARD